MPTPETIAVRFARCVDLFRDPGAKDAQKAEFRALIELLRELPVTLRIDAGRIELNGVPCDAAALAGLIARLDLHGVGTIVLPASPPAAQLFDLFRVLAEQPGADDLASRLAALGVDRIHVSSAGAMSAPPAPGPVSERLSPTELFLPSADRAKRAAPTLGTEGILRGEALRDIQSVHLSGVPLVTHDPPPPPAARALPGERGTRAAEPPVAEPASARQPPPAQPPPAEPPPPPLPQPAPPPHPGAGGAPALRTTAGPGPAPTGAADSLAELERNPAGLESGDLLAVLTQQVDTALKRNRLEEVLRLITGIGRVEQRLPDGSGARRQYGIALRRIYTKPVLEALARLVTMPKHRTEATLALQRAGADAVEVLLGILVAAPDVSERRAAFDALTQMTQGTDQLVQMLDHPEWFVVRNVAELVGELAMEEAVPALSRRLSHDDERVRRAVALALAKIGSRSAAEPLRRALRDKSPEVRMQVALGIGGRKSSALAMPLVVALGEETDDAVQRELMLALGRIGSPDAVQALIKFAQPTGRFFGRGPAGLRAAAVEGLRLAGTPAAIGTLEGLAQDGDKRVRAAAQEALTELKRPRR
jgi:HEAT repeat protein